MTKFTLALKSSNNSQYSLSHSVDVSLFNQSQYPMGDYTLIEKAVGQYINFYNIRYSSRESNFTNYKEIFSAGLLSVSGLSQRGIPINKIVVAKPSLYNITSFVRPDKLINYYRKANGQLGWWAGASFSPYINH